MFAFVNIFLDDLRSLDYIKNVKLFENSPENVGWVVCRTYDEAVEVSRKYDIYHVSLDHDLGEDSKSGYDFLCYLEESNKVIGEMFVHSDNGSGASKMKSAIRSMYRRAGKTHAIYGE